jgi:hypothetical protein
LVVQLTSESREHHLLRRSTKPLPPWLSQPLPRFHTSYPHELKETGGRALTKRWSALLDHYRMASTRIRPGASHENGVVEQGHYRLKSALEQALVLRGSREFASRAEYEAFVADVVARLNRRIASRLDQERPHLRELPPAPVPSYTTYWPTVRKWSTIRVRQKTYSVPSRLIGHEVEVQLRPERVEVYYCGKLVEQMDRLRGARTYRIDYRHAIWSLVRKPGAFARYRTARSCSRRWSFGAPTMRSAIIAATAPTSSTCGCSTWRPARVSPTSNARWRRCSSVVSLSTTPRSRSSRRRSPLPFPVLTVPDTPDLTIYDGLLAGGAR